MQLSRFLVGLAVCSMSSALPADAAAWAGDKRATCSSDNVLRALLANSAAATPFCSTYLHLPSSTVYAIKPASTITTATYTTIVTAYPSQYLPYILPRYLYSYPIPSRISSACSCLSVKETTTTVTTTPTAIATTVTSTTAFTGACATETPSPGAYNLTSTASDAFLYDIGNVDPADTTYPFDNVPTCCSVCNAYNPFPDASGGRREGYYGNCLGWISAANGDCTLLLQGKVGDGYLGDLCASHGYEPSTLDVDPSKYPYAAGGQGQCASTFNVVTT